MIVLLAAAPASADEAGAIDEPKGAEPRLIPSTSPAAPSPADARYSHKGQFEVSLRIPLGLRAIAPYDNVNYCGATDSTTRLSR